MLKGERSLVEYLQALKVEESRLQSVATLQQQEKEAIEAARQELSNQEAAIEAAHQELETRRQQEEARERSGSDLFSVGDGAAGKKRKTSVELEAATSATATDDTQRWSLVAHQLTQPTLADQRSLILQSLQEEEEDEIGSTGSDNDDYDD